MVGLNDEITVFSDQIQDREKIPPNVRFVILKYAAKCQELKDKYYKKWMKDPNFCEYGWIISDYCLDGIDGKQFTLTSYI